MKKQLALAFTFAFYSLVSSSLEAVKLVNHATATYKNGFFYNCAAIKIRVITQQAPQTAYIIEPGESADVPAGVPLVVSALENPLGYSGVGNNIDILRISLAQIPATAPAGTCYGIFFYAKSTSKDDGGSLVSAMGQF